MRTIRSVFSSLSRSPLKSTLTLLTVGLGVGVLVFTLSISSAFQKFMTEQLEKDGLVITVANVQRSADTGQIEPVRPPQFDQNVLSILLSDVSGVTWASPIGRGAFDQMVAGSTSYRIRTVVPANEQYAPLMHLSFVAGSGFSAGDVGTGVKKAIISQSLATILFGSADKAMGQTLKPPSPQMPANMPANAPRPPVMPTYTVCGVFADVGDLERTAYGVGDMIIPYTAVLPMGRNTDMAVRDAMTTVVLRVQGSSFATAEAQIRAALAKQYGDEVNVEVWEGTAFGPSTTISEVRSTVATFSLVVNLLGFVLLVTGSIGILSIMLVEVLGRTKQIAIERALGASRSAITREYFARSLILAGLSAVVGVLMSLALSGPLMQLVRPIFDGVSAKDFLGGVISPAAVGIGVAAALVVGGVFGVLPVIPALRTNIAEGMREA